MAEPGEQKRLSVEDSTKRILAAGKGWHKVLGISNTASIDDVKKAHRQLVLLHHPDKPGGDADTFRLVQQAYMLGVKKCRKQEAAVTGAGNGIGQAKSKAKCKAQSKAKAGANAKVPFRRRKSAGDDATTEDKAGRKGNEDHNAKASAAKPGSRQRRPGDADGVGGTGGGPPKRVARPKPWVLAPGATKDRVCKAVEQWQDSDNWCDKTMPDKVLSVTPEDLGAWVKTAACIPVDVREEGQGLGLRGAVSLSYSVMFSEPGQALPTVTRIKEDGRQIVLFSETPGRMGTCGLVGALLLDVFSFDPNLVRRLDGGYEAWGAYLNSNAEVARDVEPLSLRLQRRKAERARLERKKLLEQEEEAERKKLEEKKSKEAAEEKEKKAFEKDEEGEHDVVTADDDKMGGKHENIVRNESGNEEEKQPEAVERGEEEVGDEGEEVATDDEMSGDQEEAAQFESSLEDEGMGVEQDDIAQNESSNDEKLDTKQESNQNAQKMEMKTEEAFADRYEDKEKYEKQKEAADKDEQEEGEQEEAPPEDDEMGGKQEEFAQNESGTEDVDICVRQEEEKMSGHEERQDTKHGSEQNEGHKEVKEKNTLTGGREE
eukprot:TRINITY_DN32589_c0_g1_i1.p1 TRINITY_DN32589_c0_g1~~TRINITY_DN32589_c0_g1_i1.p1  ORF type:complete len:614 (+),score=171.83 TRINITY_DN32589_c0_g1_i1:41-1843(+)